MHARIYQKTASAMQSGKAGVSEWVLEFPRHDRAMPDPLMGWQSSGDTLHTIHLKFPALDDAIAYAEANEIDYIVIKKGQHRRPIRAYADNFACRRRQAWTH